MSGKIACKACGSLILAGQPWHTLAEMHWDCYRAQPAGLPNSDALARTVVQLLAPKAATPAPTSPRPQHQPIGELRLARAAGGHLVHQVDPRTGLALCGFTPSDTRTFGRRMRSRARWIGYETMPVGRQACPRCRGFKESVAAP